MQSTFRPARRSFNGCPIKTVYVIEHPLPVIKKDLFTFTKKESRVFEGCTVVTAYIYLNTYLVGRVHGTIDAKTQKAVHVKFEDFGAQTKERISKIRELAKHYLSFEK